MKDVKEMSLEELKSEQQELNQRLSNIEDKINDLEPKKVESSGGCTEIDADM